MLRRLDLSNVYAQLGRYPLYITRYVQIIKYWFRVINTNNILLKKVYDFAKQDCLKGLNNWVSNVCRLLNENGFSYVWENPFSVNIKAFIPIFRQRILDNFIQTNMSKIEKSPSLVLYRQLNETCNYKKYLDVLPYYLRMFVCRFRISSHSLRIQTDRFSRIRIPRNERICRVCNIGEIEDEYHFILKCPYFDFFVESI